MGDHPVYVNQLAMNRLGTQGAVAAIPSVEVLGYGFLGVRTSSSLGLSVGLSELVPNFTTSLPVNVFAFPHAIDDKSDLPVK